MNVRIVLLILFSCVGSNCGAADVSLTIDTQHPSHAISPRLYGIFFEDINFGGDGGLNAELVKNGAFEFSQSLMGWSQVKEASADGDVRIAEDDPAFPASPHFLRIHAADGQCGASNEGFRGIGVHAGENYEFSAHTRTPESSKTSLRVALVSDNGRTLADAELNDLGGKWSEHTAMLTPVETTGKARLVLTLTQSGTVDLDLVSLCPEKTWKGRGHGL